MCHRTWLRTPPHCTDTKSMQPRSYKAANCERPLLHAQTVQQVVLRCPAALLHAAQTWSSRCAAWCAPRECGAPSLQPRTERPAKPVRFRCSGTCRCDTDLQRRRGVLAQWRAGVWRRNGHTTFVQLTIHRGPCKQLESNHTDTQYQDLLYGKYGADCDCQSVFGLGTAEQIRIRPSCAVCGACNFSSTVMGRYSPDEVSHNSVLSYSACPKVRPIDEPGSRTIHVWHARAWLGVVHANVRRQLGA